jgi:hypothetical protein
VQLKTRAFGFPTANVLIPLVDMGNHHNECRHSLMVESCDPIEGQQQWQERKHPPLTTATGSGVYHPAASSSSSGLSGQCIVWRAEAPVAVGQVVCNNYGAGLQDRMLLQYGFLQVCSLLCDRCGVDLGGGVPVFSYCMSATATGGPNQSPVCGPTAPGTANTLSTQWCFHASPSQFVHTACCVII